MTIIYEWRYNIYMLLMCLIIKWNWELLRRQASSCVEPSGAALVAADVWMTNFHCCLFAHGFPIEMVCSKDTRLQQQSRRHSPIKWPFGSFCGRTRRRKSARIRPKGTDKYQVGKLFHDPGRMHNVDSKVSQLSIRGDKHALARFSESENFEHSFYVALHVEKHVLIAKQIAQWRRDFTTLRGREPTYEDMPEKLRRLECARICLGQRCACHNITSALCRHNHSFKSSQDFCIQLESITCDMLRHIPGYCMASKVEKQRAIRSTARRTRKLLPQDPVNSVRITWVTFTNK